MSIVSTRIKWLLPFVLSGLIASQSTAWALGQQCIGCQPPPAPVALRNHLPASALLYQAPEVIPQTVRVVRPVAAPVYRAPTRLPSIQQVSPVTPPLSGRTLSVDSTAYSLTGFGACGGQVGPGTVAMGYGADHSHCGERWRILTGSMAGTVVTVGDTIGSGSQFDIWTPNDDAYGRQQIIIEQVG